MKTPITIKFVQPYKSITSFPDAELPSFSVITGLNGVGKTHLLEAIGNGHLVVLLDGSKYQDHTYYDIGLFKTKSGSYDSHESLDNWDKDVGTIWDFILSRFKQLRAKADELSAFSADMDDDQFRRAIISSDALYESVELKKIALELDRDLDGRMKVNSSSRAAVYNIASQIGIHRILLLRDQLEFPIFGYRNLIESNISEIFVNYRDAHLFNDLLKIPGDGAPAPVSEEMFAEVFGRPPWEIVDERLKQMGTEFKVSRPDMRRYTSFDANLIREDGTHIAFDQLSSGEQVILALTLAAYSDHDNRRRGKGAGVLLLDEVDAPLHPGLARHFISTLRDVAERQGLPVMCATHSMSTVALAPDECIYVMRNDPPRLEKSTRGKALNALSVGVPMLSLSFEGRRQVFTESQADAAILNALYTLMKADLKNERSLEFIGTGIKGDASGSDTNTGCDVVNAVVERLVDAGNGSVFGLVDWDGHRQKTGRVFVLCEGERDGIENALLDPLLACALLFRYDANAASTLGVGALTYAQLLDLGQPELQKVVSAFEAIVVGASSDVVTCEYFGGFSLNLSKTYLEMDDHALEKQLKSKFGKIGGLAGNHSGDLALHVVKTILSDRNRFVPRSVLRTFEELLSYEV